MGIDTRGGGCHLSIFQKRQFPMSLAFSTPCHMFPSLMLILEKRTVPLSNIRVKGHTLYRWGQVNNFGAFGYHSI